MREAKLPFSLSASMTCTGTALPFVQYLLTWFSQSYRASDIIRVFFIYQLIHKRVALKNIKIYIKTAPTCFSSIAIRERIIWAC